MNKPAKTATTTLVKTVMLLVVAIGTFTSTTGCDADDYHSSAGVRYTWNWILDSWEFLPR